MDYTDAFMDKVLNDELEYYFGGGIEEAEGFTACNVEKCDDTEYIGEGENSFPAWLCE